MADRLQALVAVHLFLLKDNKILLSRRFNTGYRDGWYSVPAGHVDQGEFATDAMIRETKEEIGIQISKVDLKYSSVMQRVSDDNSERVDFFFTCENWTGEVTNNEPEKCDDLSWFSMDELPTNLIQYVRKGIENHLQKINFTEFAKK